MKGRKAVGWISLLVVLGWAGCKKSPTEPGGNGSNGNTSTAVSVELGDRWVPVIIKNVGDTLWIAARDTDYFAYQSRIFAWVDGQVVDSVDGAFTVEPAAPYSGGDLWAGDAILVFGENQQQRGVWQYTRGSGWRLTVDGVDMCRIEDPLQVACDRANPLDGAYTLVYTLDGGGQWDSLFLGQYEWRLGMAFDAFPVGGGKFLVMVGIPTYVLMVDVARSQIDTLWHTPDSLWIVDAVRMSTGDMLFVLGPVPDPAVTPVWLVMVTADTFQSIDTVADLTDTNWGSIPQVNLYPYEGKVYGIGKTRDAGSLDVFVFDPALKTWNRESWAIPDGLPSRGLVAGVEVMTGGKWAFLISDPLQGEASVLLFQP